ncbi:hypothetical protein [Rhodococcus sp. ABRD24]|uniref:hypothetical protein n=1 Tax=Rhodococcus sp. ABRD24 TaxID=2507582 RepID=UPI001A954FD3|nr:hypothetical protein [Rhodococcus sp. ABRD24]
MLGAEVAIQGYALAGAVVVPAEDDAAVRAAWHDLDRDVAVVILTPAAARALGAAAVGGRRLTVVMPS